ncbi:hypothetical protein EGN72_01020 [Pseudorhodobacter sp. E13]|uniref:hypothetical protein n=1 Tax=Pseudorhodobacter sp. E13 TaxID=2487931 RepID=UPI000F8EB0C6|nr:hypothetical protein [Pseudorhodobacter sp. E13]RUS65193.1 hypothetical protein EGN72_01020 [Pseudorhodobacter sp. E13]
MTDSPDFSSVGRYAKSLADDLLFTRMAEAIFSACEDIGFITQADLSPVPPTMTDEEFRVLITAALKARVQEMFDNRSSEEIEIDVNAQIESGFGRMLLYAVFLSFAEHNIFFVKR